MKVNILVAFFIVFSHFESTFIFLHIFFFSRQRGGKRLNKQTSNTGRKMMENEPKPNNKKIYGGFVCIQGIYTIYRPASLSHKRKFTQNSTDL